MTNPEATAVQPALDNTRLPSESSSNASDNFDRTNLFEGFSSLNTNSAEQASTPGANNSDSTTQTGQEPQELIMTDPFRGVSTGTDAAGGSSGRHNPVGGLVVNQDSIRDSFPRNTPNDPIDGNFNAGEFNNSPNQPDSVEESFTSPDLTQSVLPENPNRVGNYDFNYRPPTGEMTADQRAEAQREVAQFAQNHDRGKGISQNDFANEIPQLVEKLNKLGMTPSEMSRALNGEFQRREIPLVSSYGEGSTTGSLSLRLTSYDFWRNGGR